MSDKLIILAGGASSRMKKQIADDNSLTKEEKLQANQRSKALISLDYGGRPLMDYLLYNAKKAGYKSVFIITGENNDLFKEFYGNQDRKNNFNGLIINFAIQYIPKEREKPFGTADALFQAFEQYPELQSTSFTVCNSDNLYSIKALKLLRENRDAPNSLISYDRSFLQFSEERIARFAVMQFDENQYLVNIIEKPSIDQIHDLTDILGKSRVSMNIFKFDGNMFYRFIKNCPVNAERNEKEIPTALLNMVRQNPQSTKGIPISEHVPDLTSKEDISVLKEYVKNINLSDW